MKIEKAYKETIRKHQDDFDMEWMCQLCCDGISDHVLRPCEHRVCGDCWKRIQSDGILKCPWDRGDLEFK